MNRTLGRTGLSVSPIAFGAFKIGRNQKTKYAHGYELPTEKDACSLLNAVLDAGINLLDTAPAYGLSETRIGECLQSRRDEYVLSSKVGETFQDGESNYAFDAEAVNASLNRSLQQLRTTAIDLVLVHSDGRDLNILQESDVLETLELRRSQGDIRFIGFSGKSTEGQCAAIASGAVDVVMVEYNPMEDSQRAVLDAAEAAGVGVMVKKGLASGQLPAEEAIPFCLAPPVVASVVVGSLNINHLEANLQIARNALA